MDRVTTSLLNEFCAEHGLRKLPQDRQFEHFAAYLVINRYQSEVFESSDVVTGSGGDTGLDSIGVIVNGALVTDPEEVVELAERNGFLDVTFVFVQAERSPGFETSKIGQIGFGLVDFFKDTPSLPRNEVVKNAAALMTAVYQRSGRFKRGNPVCHIYYVTTGNGSVTRSWRRAHLA